MLSGKELFTLVKYGDKSVPQRGGTKDFHPDGSWLQAKRLEVYNQERKAVLGEQRIERRSSLVTGEWNPERNLVELHREMGKFWIHMGFADKNRKWLFPEEALFLMETNILETWYKGLPVSIQQAYGCFLYHGLTLEEYIVYSHLRRLGYVLKRHQGKIDITAYEKKIRLDQHVDGKKKKRKMKTDESEMPKELAADIKSESTINQNKKSKLSPGNDNITDKQQTEELIGGESSLSLSIDDELMVEKNSSINQNNNLRNLTVTDCNKSISPTNDAHEICISEGMESSEMLKSSSVGDCNLNVIQLSNSMGNDNLSSMNKNCVINVNDCELPMETDETNCKSKPPKCIVLDYNMDRSFENLESEKIEYIISDLELKNLKHSKWDFTTLNFPDIGTGKIINLVSPNTSLLPMGIIICSEDLSFNAEKYRRNSIVNQKKRNSFDQETNIENLDFSYAEMLKTQNKIQADNWTEYKEKLLSHNYDNVNDYISPVEHLWEDDVTPLLRPQEAVNTESILNKLQVIKNADLTKEFSRKFDSSTLPKISFDVYLPDSKFKKSHPGLPNHRICVLKRTDKAPDLGQIILLQNQYKDDVLLKWAVVESGDVAFYTFSNITLPVDVTMG